MTNALRLITVFGGGGFVGRYVVEALCRAGYRVRVAERHPKNAYRLQPLGAVGQIERVAADISRPGHVMTAMQGAEAVVNLVGSFNGDLDAVHVDGAHNVADAAKSLGMKAVVHISAIGADPDSESSYARTKGEGETMVREVFAKATILRPSVLFGAEDDFTNRFARMAALPVLPVLAPDTKFAPLYVADLAKAVLAAVRHPERHGGKIYELGGPDVMDMRTINRKVASMAGRPAEPLELPDAIGSLMSRFGWLPGAPLSRDQWIMLQSDNVPDKRKPSIRDLGVEPVAMDALAPEWLGRYKNGGRFAPPVAGAPGPSSPVA